MKERMTHFSAGLTPVDPTRPTARVRRLLDGGVSRARIEAELDRIDRFVAEIVALHDDAVPKAPDG